MRNASESGLVTDGDSRVRARILLVLVLAVATTLVIGCSEESVAVNEIPTGVQEGDLVDWGPSTYEAHGVEYASETGMIAVPENRNDPDSRLILVPVTRILSTGGAPAEPIFFMPGGPGLPNWGSWDSAWFLEDHDFVFVGYRGVDGSVRLDSSEVTDHMRSLRRFKDGMLSDEALSAMSDAYARDAARLESEGVDLSGYTIVETVDDMESARLALGYDQINLYSVSYGTRLAMIYDWRYPGTVSRSAMVAVNPPGHMLYNDPAQLQAILEQYAELYAGEHPEDEDLAQLLARVSREMPERWFGIRIDADMIRAASFESLGQTNSASMVFDTWIAAGKGDYSGMALLSLAGPMMFAEASLWSENAAKAASADYESTVGALANMDLGLSILGSPRSELSAAVRGWPAATIPAEYRRVRTSETETLMVSGSLDPWTPAVYAEDLLAYLPNGHHVVVQGTGHGEMLWQQSEASAALLSSFFRDGSVDDSGYAYTPWVYEPVFGFPTIAKLVPVGILVILAVIAGIVLLITRRRRRARSSAS